jgi:hypothetical protein
VLHPLGILAGLALIALILVDAFETIIQPRRITRRIRLTRLFLLAAWALWTGSAQRLSSRAEWESSTQRDRRLGVFGPLALLLLLATWAAILLVGFALIQWGLGSALTTTGKPGFASDLYLSGTTFFTLGLGDVVPDNRPARLVTVAEAALGFSFLALIISYLPTIYGAFAERETAVLLLDARAGSPPTALGLFQRFGPEIDPADLDAFLKEWERWAARLLETQLSYPVLAFFRSQHDRQSWLAALTMTLDACGLLIVGIDTATGRLPRHQARLTFAVGRHAAGDLCQVINAPPRWAVPDRLPPVALAQLRARLADAGLALRAGEAADRELEALRALYEPYVAAIGERLKFALPAWLPAPDEADDWATTAWQTDPTPAQQAVGWTTEPNDVPLDGHR